MTKLKGFACEYWIENTNRIYKENLHVSTPVIEAFEAGFIKAREEAASLSEEECFDIGCTALEADGVVRRTRDCIAEGIRKLGEEEE